MDAKMRDLPWQRGQIDEIWAYVASQEARQLQPKVRDNNVVVADKVGRRAANMSPVSP